MSVVIVWFAWIAALAAARAAARAYGRRVRSRLAAEQRELREDEKWFQKIRETA